MAEARKHTPDPGDDAGTYRPRQGRPTPGSDAAAVAGDTTPLAGPAPARRTEGGPEAPPTLHLTPDQIRSMDLEPGEVAEEERLEEDAPKRVAIGSRFRDWRTLLSFALALGVLAFAVTKANIKWTNVLHLLAGANLWLFALAFIVYYASFPIRTHRWRRLMHNANHGQLQENIDRFPLWDLVQILYLAWFANVIVPAKLGDVYRAYLARGWLGVPMSRSVGTLLAERILDLVVLFPLFLLSAFLTFQTKLFSAHDANIRLALIAGLVLAVLAGGLLVAIWQADEHMLRLLPHRFHDVYRHFRHGAVASFGSEAPALVGQTVVVWLMEGTRLMCVLAALHLLTPGKVGPAAAIFLALGSSVLTTLPLTPGGLGFVESFIPLVLVLLGVHGGLTTGAAVAVLDRLISYLSIAVIGFFVYVFSGKAQPPANAARMTGAPVPELVGS